MKKFTDTKGREWTLAINVNAIKRIRDLAQFDLLKVVEDRNAIEALQDPIRFVDVLFAALKPDADAQKITDVDFAEGLSGDVLEVAGAALLEDLADFFPSHRRGPLKKAIEKLQTIRAKAAEIQIQKMDDPATEAAIVEALRKAVNQVIPTPGSSSGNSLESPA